MKRNRRQDELNFYRRLFSRLLIILGITLMSAVVIVNVIDFVKSRSAVSAFKEQKAQGSITVDSDIAASDSVVSTISDDGIGSDDSSNESEAKDSAEQANAIALLRIHKINLEEAVREGSTNNVISSALGHMEGTAMPGEIGNCAIAGHRNYVFGRFFNRLNEVEPGDVIELETTEGIYNYTVTESIVVEPDDVSVLNQETDSQDLTLITCTPLFIGSHRLIIKGTMTSVGY